MKTLNYIPVFFAFVGLSSLFFGSIGLVASINITQLFGIVVIGWIWYFGCIDCFGLLY